MKSKNIKIWYRSGIVAVCSFVITLVLYFTGFFSFFENKTYDRRMVYSSKYKTACDDISFIIVDQESITWATENYGWGWPWPREAYAKMIDFISQGNVKSIAFDILFTEPSVYGSNDDEAFALAEKNSGKVVLPVNVRVDYDTDFQEIDFPVSVINDNVAVLGAVTSNKDDDDIIRRGRLDYTYDGVTYPTLGTASVYMEEKDLEKPFENVPKQKDGSVLLRFQKDIDEYHPYSAYDIFHSSDILQGTVNSDESDEDDFYYEPDEFDDKYVFIAYYAPGLYDICSTPVSQVFPGVGVHITTLDNYLTDSFMKQVSDFLVILWILLMVLLGSSSVAFASGRNSQRMTVVFMTAGVCLGIALSVGIPYLLFTKGIWLQLIAPAFAFFISFLICVALSFTVEGKQKRFIKSAFSQCLSKDVVNQIMNDPSSFTLGGKKYQMSAIFTDIQKFSSFSELLTASQLGMLLNYYLTKMKEHMIINRKT